jgi:HK97 gp10 family phage protein
MFQAKVSKRGKGIDAYNAAALGRDIVEAAALEAERRAKLNSPVDTGRLRSSIEGGVFGDGTGYVKAQTEYAAFQEFGTMQAGAASDPGPTPPWYQHGPGEGGIRAQPYLRPAVAEVRMDLERIAKNAAKGKT